MQQIDVFLDANVLFSASYSDTNRLLRLWHIAGIRCLTSRIIIGEVERNLKRPCHADRLHQLLTCTQIVGPEYEVALPSGIQVAAKDVHVLASAIGTHSNYLLTGDKNHFAEYFHQTVAGVIIMLPGEFLDRYPHA